MVNDWSGRPARDDKGKIIKPRLAPAGISAKLLAAMEAQPVNFRGCFCLTGVFAYASRKELEQAIQARGGTITTKVARTGCTVVVGTGASEGWAGGNYGRKIEDAAECIKAGRPVVLITEDRLTEALVYANVIEGETHTNSWSEPCHD